MLGESVVRVGVESTMELFVAETAGPAERTLLVVHGGPDWDHTYLREPLGELAGSHRVLLPDLRGCGRSTQGLPEHEYTWDAVVRDLLALLSAKHIGRADVLGFSTGGRIAQRLALAAPHRVRRLVVASSGMLPVPPDTFAGWAERDRRQAEGAEAGPDPAGLTGPELVRAWALAAAPASVWRREVLPEYLRRLAAVRFSAEWARPWQAGRLPNALPDNAVARFAELSLPILLLHGRQDMTFPAALAEEAADRLDTARAVVLDEAGHMAHIDQPKRWLSALTQFLL